MDKSFYFYFLTLPFMIIMISCQTKFPYSLSEKGFQKFITDFEKSVEPLMTQHNQAVWDSYITGKKEFFESSTELSLEIDLIYQNRDQFLYLKKLREENIISDPLLVRQLDILYKDYLHKQIDPDLNKQIKELASNIESIFANFRTVLDGKSYTDNEVTKFLQTEKNLEFREKIWRAQKSLGAKVANNIIKLAKLRNNAAQKLGYDHYFHMAMDGRELDPDQVLTTLMDA